jgi:hypothetical protein
MARHKWYTTKKVGLGGAKKKMSGWLGFGTHNARHVVMQFHRVTDCHEKSATLSCDNSTSLGLQLAIRAQNCATIELPRNPRFRDYRAVERGVVMQESAYPRWKIENLQKKIINRKYS